jgi:glycolate oxidase FAD binding subunit
MSTAASTSLARLAAMVGDTHLIASGPELAPYEIDGLRPAAAVRPGTTEEVAEIVRLATAEKLALVASGARTKLSIGWPPKRYDLALDMSRLDRIVSYDPGDLTLSVESGIRLQALSSALAERGQFLPLGVPFLWSATVGGTIATGLDSPLRQLYGTARDYLLGMEFVTGEGTRASSGGRVVKNVTGYDLHKLMIGSLGTLAVITKVNFRTFPLPVDSRAFVANFGTADQALAMTARLAQSPLRATTMEVLSPRVADLFRSRAAARVEPKPFAAEILTNNTWAFTAGFTGNEKLLDRCEGECRRMAGQAKALGISVLGRDQIAGAFGRKREFIPIALASAPAATVLKAGVLPSHMGEILARVEALTEGGSLPYAALARGTGVIYLALLPESGDDHARQRVAGVAAEVQAICEGVGGYAIIPWCPTEWKSSLKIWGSPPADLSEMRKLKSVFDPQGVLSPGRFVGGL